MLFSFIVDCSTYSTTLTTGHLFFCFPFRLNFSDILAGRKVVWDAVNCNHGPGEDPIAEAPLCRAHDTDGCRFCHDSCVGFEVRHPQLCSPRRNLQPRVTRSGRFTWLLPVLYCEPRLPLVAQGLRRGISSPFPAFQRHCWF